MAGLTAGDGMGACLKEQNLMVRTMPLNEHKILISMKTSNNIVGLKDPLNSTNACPSGH